MILLPEDCLREIFRYLEHDRRIHDLHSCLLVNRMWCDTIVPILWKNPIGISWENKGTENLFGWDNIKTNEFWERFARTTLSCLPSESRKLLMNYNIKLNIKIPEYSTFNYVGYIQFISYRIILRCIEEILDDKINSNGNILENEIWKMFMNKCSNIKYLEPTYIPIYYFPGGMTCLQNLIELECSTDVSSKFYFGLAQSCRNIQRMSIEICETNTIIDNPGLLSLIESQNGLKEVRLTSFNQTFPKLGEVLIKHVDTLTSLNFINFVCITIDSLNQLVNIKKLYICFPYGYNFRLLKFINLPRIEIINIQGGNGRSYDDLSLFKEYGQMIEKTQSTIREIFVDIDEWPEEEGMIIYYMKSLIKNCPMLEVAKIWFIEGHLEIFEDFLTRCEHLKKLIIESTSITGFWNSVEVGPLFNILANKTKNLNELTFIGILNYSSDDLIKFLESWRSKKKLYITFDRNSNFAQYRDILESFKSEGILKGWKILNDDTDNNNRFQQNNDDDDIESDIVDTPSESDMFDTYY
ncbi:hypothetical protein RclHR1_00530023 [Rhizophagus clarus]|uniref:Uncharacterized protein n=1 Tax=Rhizophagus clarus TaxID=94130 RepID=A0A2Z6RLE0_9GLOM|nr:hypothetical protein RclHR1_00530023 [Rhizophagus clarus]GES81309.1 hypothetical protein GLOIN_2v1867775 [Rhizophagus clarus]